MHFPITGRYIDFHLHPFVRLGVCWEQTKQGTPRFPMGGEDGGVGAVAGASRRV